MSTRNSLVRATNVTTLLSALVFGQAHAFTAQVPIDDGFEFLTNIGVVTAAVGEGETAVYAVPDNAIAVITDVYFLPVGASAAQVVTIKNDSADNVAGPFVVKPEEGFSKGYTSGLIFIEGQDVVVANNGENPVTVNLVGYLVCRGSCD